MPSTTPSPSSGNLSSPAVPQPGSVVPPQSSLPLTERYVVTGGTAYLITVHHVPSVPPVVPAKSDCLPVLIFESGQWKDDGTGAALGSSEALTQSETQVLPAGAQSPNFVSFVATVNFQNAQQAFLAELRKEPNVQFAAQRTYKCKLRLEFFSSGNLLGHLSLGCDYNGVSGPFQLTFPQIPFKWFKSFVTGTATAKLTLEVASGLVGGVWPVPVGQRHAPRPSAIQVTRLEAKNRYATPTDNIGFNVFLEPVNPNKNVASPVHSHNQSFVSHPVGKSFGLQPAPVQALRFTAQFNGTPVTLSPPVQVAIPEMAQLTLDSSNATPETATSPDIAIDLGKLPLPGTNAPDPKWQGKVFDVRPHYQWVYSPWYVI